jgi:hypothetical protein
LALEKSICLERGNQIKKRGGAPLKHPVLHSIISFPRKQDSSDKVRK